MARVDAPPQPERPGGTSPLVKRLVWVGIAVLMAIIVNQGRALYRGYRALQVEEARSRGNAIVGYENINPNFSYARHPADWIHDEGEVTLLWAGWKDERHDWFRIGRGEVTRAQVSPPFGCDVIRAIDHPIIEEGGGRRWDRIPDDSLVAGLEIADGHAVYPLKLLEKVEVVNDLMGEAPLLVTYRPFDDERTSVSVFDPTIGGRRITMGVSGYFLENKPLLYDRGTRSLWVERDGAMTAVAGTLKGEVLRRSGRIAVISWSEWRSRHPQSRLIVGADRTLARPRL